MKFSNHHQTTTTTKQQHQQQQQQQQQQQKGKRKKTRKQTSMRRSLKTTRARGGKKSLRVTRLDATFSQSVIFARSSSAPARYLAGGERAGRDRQRRTSLRSSSRMACSGKSLRSSRRRFARARRGSSKGMTCDEKLGGIECFHFR